jgi:hypothetical protein
MNSKKGKSSRSVFLHVGLLLQCIGPSLCASRPASHYRATVADRRDPPVGPSPPNPPLLQCRASSPMSSPSLSHPRVDSFSPQCHHLCACTRESSCRRSCSVESCRRCCLRSALLHAAPPRCWCQPLGDEALEQTTSLTQLQAPKVCRQGQGVAFPSRAEAACAGTPVCATWLHCFAPCPAHLLATGVWTKIPSASPPR